VILLFIHFSLVAAAFRGACSLESQLARVLGFGYLILGGLIQVLPRKDADPFDLYFGLFMLILAGVALWHASRNTH